MLKLELISPEFDLDEKWTHKTSYLIVIMTKGNSLNVKLNTQKILYT